jgi:hypothetical protein
MAIRSSLTREEYADAVRGSGRDTNDAHSQDSDAGDPPDGGAAVPAVAHFHAEFKRAATGSLHPTVPAGQLPMLRT